METAQKVVSQTAQIQRIYDELYDIDDNLERAKKITSRMLRRMMSDRILWLMIFLVFAVACVAVIESL